MLSGAFLVIVVPRNRPFTKILVFQPSIAVIGVYERFKWGLGGASECRNMVVILRLPHYNPHYEISKAPDQEAFRTGVKL